MMRQLQHLLVTHKAVVALTSVILIVAIFLRFFRLDSVPISPYWEEVALGYDAYSILQTGKDHHGNAFPIVAFESFGDYKPTLYFYVIVPFLKIFDLGVLAVRFPSAISGVMIVIGVGCITRLLVRTVAIHSAQSSRKIDVQRQVILALLAMAVTAISPWAVMFSRAGWEVNLATALVVWGVYFGWKSWGRSGRSGLQLLTAAVLLILAMYTYHATRLIAPLLGLAIAIPWIKRLLESPLQSVKALLPTLLSLVLLLPLALSLGDASTSQRFAETSIFSDISIIETSNQAIQDAGGGVFARLVHHRYLYFGKEILSNFFDHFQLDYLFINGDVNPRHALQYLGQLYYTELFFALAGMFALWRWRWYKNPRVLFLGWWMLVGILPASVTTATPHALRTLPVMPVWMMVIAVGIWYIVVSLDRKWLQVLAGSIIFWTYSFQFAIFGQYYFAMYPTLTATHWQYGYSQMIRTVEQSRTDEPVWITRHQGRPAMYYWFYTKTDPRLVQAADSTAPQDQGEYLQFEHIGFVDRVTAEMRGIIAADPETFATLGGEQIEEIKAPDDSVVWVVFRR